MSINEIPVRVVGPGSQPDTGSDLRYIDMPNDMARFSAPHIPEPEAVTHLAGAREAMYWLGEALSRYEPGMLPQLANVTGLDAENRELVNQILGEGEVSIVLQGDVEARCQESILAGVWRTLYFDEEGRVIADLLEVAAWPHLLQAAGGEAQPVDVTAPAGNETAVNALPILVELQAHVEAYDGNGKQHSINLSLLPLSDSDAEFLDDRLGRGSIDILSRGYGKCQVISTLTPNVWWVRYYNSMDTLILNSIEVVAVPEVVTAAEEDLRDSAVRLAQILAPYWQDEA
jgi:hydrogenase-1 operon protein HyaF